MTKNHPNIETFCIQGDPEGCGRKRQKRGQEQSLAKSCCRSRMRICKIGGDRKFCARMAHLGLLPGREMEVLCPGRGHQCMIKIDGGTISLDNNMAENIIVTPA